VGETREHQRRAMPRQCRYPLEFRGDGLGTRCSRHLSLARFRCSRLLLPSPGSSRGEFPGFAGTMRSSDFPPRVPLASLPSRAGDRPALASFASTRAERCVSRPGAWSPGAPFPGRRRRTRRDLPGSWGTLGAHAPLSDPGRTRGASLDGVANAAFHQTNGCRLLPLTNFGALSRGLRPPCVRFAAEVALAPRNTRFRLVAHLCRAGLVHPLGPAKGFGSTSPPPFPGLPGATAC
jgi:hypothetical protein